MSLTPLLQQATPDDAVLHIGPGALYSDINYDVLRTRFLIVDPDPFNALSMKKRLAGRDAADVLNRGVAHDQDERTYYEFNFPVMNSQRAPSDMESFFPGLELRATHKTDPITIPQLLGRMPKDHRANDILIIDALGEAMDVLSALEKANALLRFAHIVIRAPRLACFEGSVPLADIASWLSDRFFGEPLPLAADDPDFPTVLFSRDAVREELDKTARLKLVLENDLKALQREHTELSTKKEAQDQLFLQAAQRLSETSGLLGEILEKSAPDEIVKKLKALMAGDAPSGKSASE